MANFNPQERDSLMSLLSALNGGLSGSQGYSALGNILSQQQTRIDNRQERMGSLIDMLVNNAGSGGSLQASRALARAYTNGSNIPPQIRGALQDLYPQESGPESMSYGLPQGPGDPSQSFSMPAPSSGPAQTFSPLAQQAQAPMTPQDQLAYMQIQENQAQQAAAPATAQALVTQAVSVIGTPNPDTGATILPQDILPMILASPTFASLDPYTQSMVVELAKQELAKHGSISLDGSSPSSTVAAAAAPAAPTGGRYGSMGLNNQP